MHPDKNCGDEKSLEKFTQLQEAKEVLTDDEVSFNFSSVMCICIRNNYMVVEPGQNPCPGKIHLVLRQILSFFIKNF